MSAKTMAEVPQDLVEAVKAALHTAETTGPRAGASLDALAHAAIQVLTAAGFGLVADAKAEALEDAADIAGRPENRWWAEGQNRAKWLRSLAAEMRQP